MGRSCNKKIDDGKVDSYSKPIIIALFIKLLLCAAQVVAGIYSNSMALIADAVHNITDFLILSIALFATIVAKKPPDTHKTFGYKKIEVVAAVINFTVMILMGVYLIFEAVGRYFHPHHIDGKMVIVVSALAFIGDIIAAWLIYKGSKKSMNLKVVFIENITDAFSSLAVLFSGVVILLYGWYVTDIIAALIIACYIIYYGATGLPKAVNILIAAKPEDLNLMGLIKDLEAVEGVHNVHHVHVWQLDEEKAAMEAHVVIENLNNMEQIKIELKKILKDDYCIDHSTLEFERFIEGFKQDKCH